MWESEVFFAFASFKCQAQCHVHGKPLINGCWIWLTDDLYDQHSNVTKLDRIFFKAVRNFRFSVSSICYKHYPVVFWIYTIKSYFRTAY